MAFLAGAYWRLSSVGSALIFGDEFHSLRLAMSDYRGVLTVFEPNGSGMALPLLQRLAIDISGASHWALRAPAWIPSLITLGLIYPLGRRMLGSTAAAIASWFVAVNSFLVFYGHFGRAYSLVALLALLLIFLCHRSVECDDLPPRRYWALAAVTGLLPWVHLSSLLYMAPVLAATLLALSLGERPRRNGARLVSAALMGAIGGLLLHVSAWNSLARFLTSKLESPYTGSFNALDIGALLTGSRGGAILIGIMATACAVGFVYRQQRVAWPLVAGAIGAPALLALVQPFGDAYAYARYLTAIVPGVLLLTGWGIAEACHRLFSRPHVAEIAGLAIGISVTGLLFVQSPLGPKGTDEGPHANTYMNLYPLPAFDLSWEAAPPFYQQLARNPIPQRIIEVPALTNRARHLYRSYYRLHGKPTSLGLLGSELWHAPEGPYVSLRDTQALGPEAGDYLILHYNLDREAARYWNFVYRDNPQLSTHPATTNFMNRHHRLQRISQSLPQNLGARLHQTLGNPVYRDEEIIVWSLQP
jgi:hypothetical protein